MDVFETTGKTWIGHRNASGRFVKLRARADDLSITTPIASISFSPREVVAFRPLTGLFGYGGFEIVHTRDRRKVQFWCRHADDVRAQILATGFMPRGTPGGGPDPTRAAIRAEEQRAGNRGLLKFGGLLALVLVVILAVVAFGLGLSMKNNDVYRTSWATVQADPRVVAHTGQPMTSETPSGSIEEIGATGHAALHYRISGPSGQGTVQVDGARAAGEWHVDRLVFEPDGQEGRSIDLLDGR